jgi:hypothetical protein
MKYDIEMQTLQTLSQKLSNKMPNLQDFAVNAYADKIASIDLYLSLYSDDEKLVKELSILRNHYVLLGRALYIKRADVLTNLGLAVGVTGIKPAINGSYHE